MSEKISKKVLDSLYNNFDFGAHRGNDPIEIPHRYREYRDIETAAFITAMYSYGKVELFMKHLNRLFAIMGSSPYDYIMELDAYRGSKDLKGLNYRFSKDADLLTLVISLRDVLRAKGSLNELFLKSYKKGSIRDGLITFISEFYSRMGKESITAGVRHLLTDPARGSACKRLNMFMRWMVRNKDIDFGIWTGVAPADLIIPLDTHIARISGCIGLTSRKSTDWRTAEDITLSLKEYDRNDPLKYDFVLCHQGISGICRADRSLCDKCGLKDM